jgi:hypothetical protein
MLQLKPKLEHHSICPHCAAVLTPVDTLWMGMHILVKSKCANCQAEIIEDAQVGHSLYHEANKIDLDRELVFGRGMGHPNLIESLKTDRQLDTQIQREVLREFKRVIVLNCLDYLYGHCLLKLLNIQKHLDDFPEYGTIAIVPKFLRWLVPDGVAEVWTIDIPLKHSLLCYSAVNDFVRGELMRFDEIYVSSAISHPSEFDISKFTKVPKHDFDAADYRITFVWREDRLWCDDLMNRILKKTNLLALGLIYQNWQIRRLFGRLRRQFPAALFTIAGLGSSTRFPEWIDDRRVPKFDRDTERATCQIYAQSRLIVGVHGSNMLLPSAHAGMTIDLLSADRLGNITQDILYQESDPRLAAFRYRYLTFQTSIAELAQVGASMLLDYRAVERFMRDRRA